MANSQELSVNYATLSEKVDNIQKDVSSLLAIMDGNGTPGLKVRIAALETVQSNQKWFLRCILGALIVGVIGLLLRHFQF